MLGGTICAKTLLGSIPSINSTVYVINSIWAADCLYVRPIINGNPEEELLVEIKPQKKGKLIDFAIKFNNQLLNYAVYKKQSEKNKEIRDAIVQRAMLTSEVEDLELEDIPAAPKKTKEKTILDEDEAYFGSSDSDPEGIKKAWK